MRALFATAQQPHSRDIFLYHKILPLDKLINQQEGIHAYKVINGTCLTTFSLTDIAYIIKNLETMKSKNSPSLNDTQTVIYSL